MTNNNTLKILLVLAGLLFMSGVAYLGVEYFNKDNLIKVQSVEIDQLEGELLEIENNLNHLEIIYDDRQEEIDVTNELLEQSYARVKKYEEVIERLKREGKIDKRKISELETILARLKGDLSERYKTELDRVYQDNQKQKSILDTMIKKDQERRQQYAEETNRLRNEVDSLRRVVGKNQKYMNMVNKLTVANFKFFNKKISNGKVEAGYQFKHSDLEVLQVRFDILESYAAEAKLYQLYMIIRSPDGFILANPEEGYGGNESIQGQMKTVSNEAPVNYTKTKESVTIDFKLPTSETWTEGLYKVQIMHEGDILGEGEFRVN